jgi:molybdenum cofactor cytidylyltransferase
VRSFAVVPAAGKSRRMGRPKLALPYQGGTVLEAVVRALKAGGVDHVVAVIGPHVVELEEPARRAGCEPLLLPDETPDMRSTVEAGLRWLEERFRPRPDDVWLLAPADHPTLDASVVHTLLDAASGSGASLAVPTFEGKRGHPTLLRWQHVEGIRALPRDQGINAYLRQNAGGVQEVPGGAAEVLWDLDTPDDYARLLGRRV